MGVIKQILTFFIFVAYITIGIAISIWAWRAYGAIADLASTAWRAAGFGRRESRRGEDHGRRLERDGLRLPPHPTRAVGIPAVVARRDMPLVGDVHEHPGQELERVGGLGPRRSPLRLMRAMRHRLWERACRTPDPTPKNVSGLEWHSLKAPATRRRWLKR